MALYRIMLQCKTVLWNTILRYTLYIINTKQAISFTYNSNRITYYNSEDFGNLNSTVKLFYIICYYFYQNYRHYV